MDGDAFNIAWVRDTMDQLVPLNATQYYMCALLLASLLCSKSCAVANEPVCILTQQPCMCTHEAQWHHRQWQPTRQTAAGPCACRKQAQGTAALHLPCCACTPQQPDIGPLCSNFQNFEQTNNTQMSFPPSAWAKVVAAKATYDPANLFRDLNFAHNQGGRGALSALPQSVA